MKSLTRLGLVAATAMTSMAATAEITISFVDSKYDAEVVESIQQPVLVSVNPADAQYTGSVTVDASGDQVLTSAGTLVWVSTDGAKTQTYDVKFTAHETGIWRMLFYPMAINEETAGTYTLKVDAGAFVKGNESSPELTHVWTIKEKAIDVPGDADITPQMILPYEDEEIGGIDAYDFTTITVMFAWADGDVKYDPSHPITLTQDATGTPVDITVTTNGNMLRVSFTVVYNGLYTLHIPAGAVSNNAGICVETSKSWNVVGGETAGIGSIGSDSHGNGYYDVQGRKIETPARGSVVIRVADGKTSKIRF